MVRGFYTAASGIVTQEKRLNNIGNNIANVSTVGYKKDETVLGTFGEHVTLRKNAYEKARTQPIGPGVYMQVMDEKYTSYAQGGFEATSRPMDLSLMGAGFFLINTTEGEQLMTRDGQFSLDEEGYLIYPGFGRVQGENGDIEIGTSAFTVDSQGNIYIESDEGELEQVDRLLVAIPDDYDTVEKVRDTLFTSSGYTLLDPEADVEEGAEPQTTVRQYQLEKSNVSMTDEMTNMIGSQRALQSCSQIVRMYDEMADQIATRVSRTQ